METNSQAELSRFSEERAEYLCRKLAETYRQINDLVLPYYLIGTEEAFAYADSFVSKSLNDFCEREMITVDLAQRLLGKQGDTSGEFILL